MTPEEKELTIQARQIIYDNFITANFVHSCAEVMVTKYMLLTPSDLEQWENDPESWANSVDAENWEFELRVSENKVKLSFAYKIISFIIHELIYYYYYFVILILNLLMYIWLIRLALKPFLLLYLLSIVINLHQSF